MWSRSFNENPIKLCRFLKIMFNTKVPHRIETGHNHLLTYILENPLFVGTWLL